MTKDILYFIALIPPQDIQAEVTEFKQYVAAHFDSKKALTSPPHITLIPPFHWKKEKLSLLQKSLKNFMEKQASFPIALRNFDHFGAGVIFVDVVDNEDLIVLQEVLRTHLETTINLKYKRSGRPFHAHMTVAYRDLEETVFPAAWAHFSAVKYERLFQAKQIVLLKRVEKRWEVFEGFSFDGDERKS